MKIETKTTEEVKREFERAGISIGSWAKANGFHRQDVYAVLNGQNKARYGKAHAIAVALGLKEGEVVNVGSFRPVPRVA